MPIIRTALRILIFTCIYFREIKKIVFREYLFSGMVRFLKFRLYLFLRMASFWKFGVYKFQPQRKKNKKKTVESRDIRLMFLSKSRERQAGHDGKFLLSIDSSKSWINQHFLCIFFFRVFSRNMNFGYISRMPFKRKSRVYLILRNSPKFAKFAKIFTREN